MTALRPGQAAYIAGLTTPVLRDYARAGKLTRDAQGCYDAAQIHALRAEMDRAREEAKAAARERYEARVRRQREQRRAAAAARRA